MNQSSDILNKKLTIVFIVICTERQSGETAGIIFNAIDEFISTIKRFQKKHALSIYIDELICAQDAQWRNDTSIPLDQYEWKDPQYGGKTNMDNIVEKLKSRFSTLQNDYYAPIFYLFSGDTQASPEKWDELKPSEEIFRKATRNAVPIGIINDESFFQHFADRPEHILPGTTPDILKKGLILKAPNDSPILPSLEMPSAQLNRENADAQQIPPSENDTNQSNDISLLYANNLLNSEVTSAATVKKDLSGMEWKQALETVCQDLYEKHPRGALLKIKFIYYLARILNAKAIAEADTNTRREILDAKRALVHAAPKADQYTEQDLERIAIHLAKPELEAVPIHVERDEIKEILKNVGSMRIFETEPKNASSRLQNFQRNFNNNREIKTTGHITFNIAEAETVACLRTYHTFDHYRLPPVLAILETEPQPVAPAQLVPLLENAQFQQANDALFKKNQSLLQNNRTLFQNNTPLNTQLNSLNTQINALLNEVEQLKTDNATLSSNNENLLKKNKEYVELIDENKVLKSQINGLKSQTNTLSQENADLNNQINELNTQISKLSLEKSNYDNLIKELERLKTDNTTLNSNNESLLQKYQEYVELIEEDKALKSQINRLTQKYVILIDENKALKSQINGLKSETNTLTQENTDLNNQINALNTQINTLLNEVECLKTELELSVSFSSNNESLFQNLKSQINTLSQENADLKTKQTTLLHENADLRTQTKYPVNFQIKPRSNKYENNFYDNANFTQEYNHMIEHIHEINTENDEHKQRCTSKISRIIKNITLRIIKMIIALFILGFILRCCGYLH